MKCTLWPHITAALLLAACNGEEDPDADSGSGVATEVGTTDSGDDAADPDDARHGDTRPEGDVPDPDDASGGEVPSPHDAPPDDLRPPDDVPAPDDVVLPDDTHSDDVPTDDGSGGDLRPDRALTEEELCADDGGRWDELSCGHYECGVAPSCRAIIPGCDCGAGRTFDPELGCAADPDCEAPGADEALCADTGGTWDPWSCGHYSCGAPPLCLAIIPGCDCGASANFVAGRGCVPDAACDAPGLCASTGGAWDDGGCGYVCGEPVPILCLLPIPDCDCAPGKTFDPVVGCVGDDSCPGTSAERLCVDTAGRWDPTACGDAVCGDPPDCEAIIPGCNCGMGRVFSDASGCIGSRMCFGCPDPMNAGVQYVSGSNFDPEVCTRIRFVCEEGWEMFSIAECGCGCMRIP